jgi:hypothetical protein
MSRLYCRSPTQHVTDIARVPYIASRSGVSGLRSGRARVMLGPMRDPSKVLGTALASVLSLLALVLSGCTGENEGGQASAPPAPDATQTGSAPALRAEPASYDVAYGRVAGHVPRPRREATLRTLSRPVRTWMGHGFVDGPWPRDGFQAAFAPFAAGIRSTAMRDADLLTLQRSGSSLAEVIPVRRMVKVSVTTHRARVVGATARVDLRLLTVDRSEHEERVGVRGDLYLTPVEGRGWSIYGYDLEQVHNPPSGAQSDGQRDGQRSDAGGEEGG